MFEATRRWFRRNRNGLAIGVGVIGAGYLAGQYVLSKISEARERMSSDRIARENLRRRFEQNQTDCTFTVLALLPTATENILDALAVEELTHELQQKRAQRLNKLSGGELTGSEISSGSTSITEDDGRSLSSFQGESYIHTSQLGDVAADGEKPKPKRSKAQLWNELKINSITRTFTLIYTLSLLALLTRIQLNLLGRRNYLSSVVSMATPPPNASTISLEDRDDDHGTQGFGNDFETNRRYLTFSWWLLHRGWKDMMEKVEEAVKEIFGPINPREDITLVRLSELTLAVRKKVEGQTDEERKTKKWLAYLLPPQEQEDSVLEESGVLSASSPTSPQTAASLRRLLDETSDLIDSPSFTHILTLLNNEAFSTLIDQKCATEAFTSAGKPQQHTSDPQSFSSSATIIPASAPSMPKAKLATILAVIARQAHSIGNGANPPNEYLVAMEQGVRELEAFAAVVYSSNFELNPLSGLEPQGVADAESVPLTNATTPAGDGVGTPSAEAASFVEVGESFNAAGNPNLGEVADSGFEKAWGKAVDAQD